MPTNSLAAKMKLKPGAQAAIIAAPEGYRKELSPLPTGARISTVAKGTFDWIQVFVKTKKELEKLAPQALRALKSDGILWISFPKGSSAIQTDLTRDKGWDVLRKADLKWITLISVDETWSAFGLRHYKSGEAKQSFR